MSFWNLKTSGQEATGEVESTEFGPLPGASYTMMFEEVANKEWEDDRYINLKARVVSGDFSNRVVFLKLKVYETQSKFYNDDARDKALQKLVKLYQVLKVKLPNGEPDDRSLSQLTDKPLDVKLGVWKDNDTKEAKGNYIVDFAPKGEQAGSAKPMPKTNGKTPPMMSGGAMSDDVPFAPMHCMI